MSHFDPQFPSDRIFIRNLRLRCVIGLQEWERKVRQDVVITIVLHLSTRLAGESDAIADTVDYKGLTKGIIADVEGSSHQLVERLAERIAALCLEPMGVTAVEVTVEKPGALRYADTVGVTIVRHRE